jgi:hypothetical protein
MSAVVLSSLLDQLSESLPGALLTTFGMVLAVSWFAPFLDTINGSIRKGRSAVRMGNVGSKRLVLL